MQRNITQNSDKAALRSLSPSLTCRRIDCTYTDGSLQQYELGQDNGSGVYHPDQDVSDYPFLSSYGGHRKAAGV